MIPSLKSPLLISLALILLLVTAGCTHYGVSNSQCINMNGNEIVPSPELCKSACSQNVSSAHMQAHYNEVCNCCKAKNIDYKDAGEYQPRIYVINPDGSNGEDITCNYYPDAKGCETS